MPLLRKNHRIGKQHSIQCWQCKWSQRFHNISRGITEQAHSCYTPSISPLHKKGMVPMLMWNLSAKQGLCNNKRLILNKLTNIFLHRKIASEDYAREEVLISEKKWSIRMNNLLNWTGACSQSGLLLHWQWTNVSVRQKNGGSWQEAPTFTHGQLYVAASRIGDH